MFVGEVEPDRGGARLRTLVFGQRERQAVVGDRGLQNPLGALRDGNVVRHVVTDLVGVGHEVVGRGRNRAILGVTFVRFGIAVQLERRQGDALRDGEHRFGDLALGVFDEEGQIGDARESGVVVRDLERDSLVGGRDVGDPRFDGCAGGSSPPSPSPPSSPSSARVRTVTGSLGRPSLS